MPEQKNDTTKVSETWGKIYVLVIGILLVVMTLLYVFTQHFK
jgi:hypothetical protein